MFIKRSIIVAIAAALIFPAISLAEDVKVIESEGRAEMDMDMTQAEAIALSKNDARRRALEEAVGIKVTGEILIYNDNVISDLVKTATKGLIVKEEVLAEKWEPLEGNRMGRYIRLRAHVKPLPPAAEGTLKIKSASVQRPDKKEIMKVPVFQHGDESQIRVRANEDCYFYIFGVDQNGNLSILFPNDYVKEQMIPADTELVFPNDSMRALGLKIRVSTLKGLSKSVESVVVIATKQKVKFFEINKPENPTITDLMREISELGEIQWTQKTLGYEVRK